METTTYEEAAEKFLNKAGAKLESKFLYHGNYFDDDKATRDVYEITITRNDNKWKFNFGQSINNSGDGKRDFVKGCPSSCLRYASNSFCPFHDKKRSAPTVYDVLSCIEKSDPGTFDDFCGEFGYDTDSRKAEKTYFLLQKEFANVQKMFGDVIEELQEIQ